MKTILFRYESPAGTFWIRPEPAGRVQLGLDRRKLRTYGSAKEAARAVAEQATGWPAWDTASGILIPSGLEKWKRGMGASKPRSGPSAPNGDEEEEGT